MHTFKKLPKIRPKQKNPAPRIHSGCTRMSHLAGLKGIIGERRECGSYERSTVLRRLPANPARTVAGMPWSWSWGAVALCRVTLNALDSIQPIKRHARDR